MLIILVLSVFVLLIGFLLFMPILICIDTDKALYYIKLKGLVTIGIEADKAEILQIKVHVFFKDFYFYPLHPLHQCRYLPHSHHLIQKLLFHDSLESLKKPRN